MQKDSRILFRKHAKQKCKWQHSLIRNISLCYCSFVFGSFKKIEKNDFVMKENVLARNKIEKMTRVQKDIRNRIHEVRFT